MDDAVPRALVAVLVAGALLAAAPGCARGGGSAGAVPDAPASSTIPGQGEPAPPEALAPAPSIRAATDARELLKPGGDLNLLKMGVAAVVARLSSVHVEKTVVADHTLTYSFDVDDTGRCSGTYVEPGVDVEFITDGERTVITTDEGTLGAQLDGRWLELPHQPTTPLSSLTTQCWGGPLDVVFMTTDGAGRWWWLADAKRIGVDQVGGRATVHFRKAEGGHTADTWVFAERSSPRLAKLTSTESDGVTQTMVFSQFDSAGPVRPMPADDHIVSAGQLSV